MIQEQVRDAYIWGAIYDDNSCIGEYDRLEGRGFAEVESARVKEILLLSLARDAAYSVKIPQGAAPVFFRRRSIEINLVQEQSNQRPTVHCIGWKKADEAVYLFIFDDGSTLLTNDLQAV